MKREDVFPSRWLNAADLEGKKCRAIMSQMQMQEIQVGEVEKPILYFKRAQVEAVKAKGLVLNSTNWDLIEAMYGDSENWDNKEITLYPTKTTFRGKIVDCIRVEFRQPDQPMETKPTVTQNSSTRATPKAAVKFDERNPPPSDTIPDDMSDEIPF